MTESLLTQSLPVNSSAFLLSKVQVLFAIELLQIDPIHVDYLDEVLD